MYNVDGESLVHRQQLRGAGCSILFYGGLFSLESDMIHSLSLSTDKLKGTIQLLQQNTDLWHVGQDTVDLRMARRTFARVQQYIPECRVLIDNVEEHIQQAEAEMFPARLQEEEVWAQSVLESVLNTKVIFYGCC